jgi:hypothetical protein
MRAVDCRSAIFRRGIALLENARARLRSYPPLRKERARVGHPLWWFCKGGASPHSSWNVVRKEFDCWCRPCETRFRSFSFAPLGLVFTRLSTQGLRPGLHSIAASRLTRAGSGRNDKEWWTRKSRSRSTLKATDRSVRSTRTNSSFLTGGLRRHHFLCG